MFNKFRKARDRYAELQAVRAPFYVSSEGALFAKAEEVIRSQAVQEQLKDFAVLHDKILASRNAAPECEPAR